MRECHEFKVTGYQIKKTQVQHGWDRQTKQNKIPQIRHVSRRKTKFTKEQM